MYRPSKIFFTKGVGRSKEYFTEELQVSSELHYVIVDLHAKKATVEILAKLNRSYPFADNEQERGVQELLGPINKRIVNQAMDALRAGDAEKLGALMTEAQAFFDKYATPACPEELTAPVLHEVLNYEPLKQHIWGGKGVGSQGDGTAQFLARSENDQQAIIEIIERDLNMSCLKLSLKPAHKVRKALIPAAGYGTRMFPASKATQKELFPIIDRDGIAKPAILLIVEEALQAGIEEVVIIVQEDDLDDFKSFLDACAVDPIKGITPQQERQALANDSLVLTAVDVFNGEVGDIRVGPRYRTADD